MTKKKKSKTKKEENVVSSDIKVDKKKDKLTKKKYEKQLNLLQVELVKLQRWIHTKDVKVVVLFEGRDAAGKGGVIKRITQSLNPRICKVVALGTPTEKEKTRMVFSKVCASSSRGW